MAKNYSWKILICWKCNALCKRNPLMPLLFWFKRKKGPDEPKNRERKKMSYTYTYQQSQRKMSYYENANNRMNFMRHAFIHIEIDDNVNSNIWISWWFIRQIRHICEALCKEYQRTEFFHQTPPPTPMTTTTTKSPLTKIPTNSKLEKSRLIECHSLASKTISYILHSAKVTFCYEIWQTRKMQ